MRQSVHGRPHQRAYNSDKLKDDKEKLVNVAVYNKNVNET